MRDGGREPNHGPQPTSSPDSRESHQLTTESVSSAFPMCKKVLRRHSSNPRDREKAASALWVDKHKSTKRALGIESAAKWSELPSNSLAPILAYLPARERDILDMAHALALRSVAPGTRESEALDGVIVDISQCGSRRPWTLTGKMRTLTSSSCLWSFRKGRLLSPVEHLLVMGFGAAAGKGATRLSDGAVQDLAGEAMSVQCIGACLLCLLTALPDHWTNS